MQSIPKASASFIEFCSRSLVPSLLYHLTAALFTHAQRTYQKIDTLLSVHIKYKFNLCNYLFIDAVPENTLNSIHVLTAAGKTQNSTCKWGVVLLKLNSMYKGKFMMIIIKKLQKLKKEKQEK